jgi:hypothetical protein
MMAVMVARDEHKHRVYQDPQGFGKLPAATSGGTGVGAGMAGRGSYLMWPCVKSRLFSSHEYSINSSPGFRRQNVRVLDQGRV